MRPDGYQNNVPELDGDVSDGKRYVALAGTDFFAICFDLNEERSVQWFLKFNSHRVSLTRELAREILRRHQAKTSFHT